VRVLLRYVRYTADATACHRLRLRNDFLPRVSLFFGGELGEFAGLAFAGWFDLRTTVLNQVVSNFEVLDQLVASASAQFENLVREIFEV
jgi:hypothetical protein